MSKKKGTNWLWRYFYPLIFLGRKVTHDSVVQSNQFYRVLFWFPSICFTSAMPRRSLLLLSHKLAQPSIDSRNASWLLDELKAGNFTAQPGIACRPLLQAAWKLPSGIDIPKVGVLKTLSYSEFSFRLSAFTHIRCPWKGVSADYWKQARTWGLGFLVNGIPESGVQTWNRPYIDLIVSICRLHVRCKQHPQHRRYLAICQPGPQERESFILWSR